MRRYGLYIFDLDGTLYRGAEALPGAVETVTTLRTAGAQIRFLTNNSSRTPEDQAEKLRAMGFEASADQVLTSGVGAAAFLSQRALDKVFVVGEPGLVEVLAANGIHSVAPEEEADAVLVGIYRSFTYDLLNEAMQRILRGSLFLATNTDASYPLEAGRLIPGAGAIVAAVSTCTGRDPTVIGKPEPLLIDMILRQTGVPASDTLVVGDRFETDILAGRNAGCDTALVLTGVSSEVHPETACLHSLAELLP